MNFTDIHNILREAAKMQKQTAKDFDKMQKKFAAEIAALRKLQREDAKKADREMAEIRQFQREDTKKATREMAEIRQSQKQTDERFRKTDEQFRKTDKKLKDIGRLVGDLGGTQGSVAEDLFSRNTSPLFAKLNKEFHDIRRNFTARGKSEYDIVALNNKEVLVIEVKNKLTEPDIDRFIYTQLPRFKVDFPKYLTYSLIGGVAGLSIKEPVEKYAERKGLYVLTQSGKGTAKLANSPRFKEKIFA